MAAYLPLIGNNLIVSFVDAGAAAVTKAPYTGRPGTNRFAAILAVNPGAVANDLTLTLTLRNSQLFSTLADAVAFITDPGLSAPVVTISPGTQSAAAQTPAAILSNSAGVSVGSLFGVNHIFTITFTDDTVAGVNDSILNIDWGYSASN